MSLSTKRTRPRPEVPRSGLEIGLELLGLALLLATIGLTIWAFATLPARIPSHYDLAGHPNTYGGKGSLLIFPLMSVAMYALLSWLNLYPHTFNYPVQITEENAARQYHLARMLLIWIKLAIAAEFLYLEWVFVQAAHQPGNGPNVLLILLGGVLVPIVAVVVSWRLARRVR